MRYNKIKMIIICLFINFLLSEQQEDSTPLSLSFYDFQTQEFINKKDNIIKPMGMSLLVPGLGQYQKGDKIRGAFFFGIELISLYLENHYNDKADIEVRAYKNYSDEHWDFEDWITDYHCWNPAYQGINSDCNYDFSHLFSNIVEDENGNEFQDYRHIWDNSHHIKFYWDNDGVNTLTSTNDAYFESTLFNILFNWNANENEGQSFVDFYNIEVVKDHHFYEGIRKYNMFFAGWDDSTEDIEEVIQASGYAVATSPNKRFYNSTWNKSIELYDYAQYALTAIYLNHVISMFDIYFKSKFDNRFSIEADSGYQFNLKTGNYGLKLSVNL